MNIFYLDELPFTCAAYHCDRHVVKMVLEYAQIISTTHRILDNWDKNAVGLYKQTHVNHPSVIWARTSYQNYSYLASLFSFLCKEYTYRYGKVHKADMAINYHLGSALYDGPKNIPDISPTPIPLCMPDDVKTNRAVDSYRNYYNKYKAPFARWTKREVPSWFTGYEQYPIIQNYNKGVIHNAI